MPERSSLCVDRFVGRAAELRRLEYAWRDADRGGGGGQDPAARGGVAELDVTTGCGGRSHGFTGPAERARASVRKAIKRDPHR
jgi:hypothetical protein